MFFILFISLSIYFAIVIDFSQTCSATRIKEVNNVWSNRKFKVLGFENTYSFNNFFLPENAF